MGKAKSKAKNKVTRHTMLSVQENLLEVKKAVMGQDLGSSSSKVSLAHRPIAGPVQLFRVPTSGAQDNPERPDQTYEFPAAMAFDENNKFTVGRRALEKDVTVPLKTVLVTFSCWLAGSHGPTWSRMPGAKTLIRAAQLDYFGEEEMLEMLEALRQHFSLIRTSALDLAEAKNVEITAIVLTYPNFLHADEDHPPFNQYINTYMDLMRGVWGDKIQIEVASEGQAAACYICEQFQDPFGDMGRKQRHEKLFQDFDKKKGNAESSSLAGTGNLNLAPEEAARRHDMATKSLLDSGIDPATLSPELLDMFANQSPDVQKESLAMLVKYGAERLIIVHPDKDATSSSSSSNLVVVDIGASTLNLQVMAVNFDENGELSQSQSIARHGAPLGSLDGSNAINDEVRILMDKALLPFSKKDDLKDDELAALIRKRVLDYAKNEKAICLQGTDAHGESPSLFSLSADQLNTILTAAFDDGLSFLEAELIKTVELGVDFAVLFCGGSTGNPGLLGEIKTIMENISEFGRQNDLLVKSLFLRDEHDWLSAVASGAALSMIRGQSELQQSRSRMRLMVRK